MDQTGLPKRENPVSKTVLPGAASIQRKRRGTARKNRKRGQGETFGFPRFFCPEDKRICRNHFCRGVYVAKIPRPVRPWGAHTSDRRHW